LRTSILISAFNLGECKDHLGNIIFAFSLMPLTSSTKMKRRNFLKHLSVTALTLPMLPLKSLAQFADKLPESERLPVLFLAHGHPINAIKDTRFTQSLSQVGKQMPRPQAIMVVSAHWETKGTFVSVNPTPQTIHDFGRFNDSLFQVQYNAPGHPTLAREVAKLSPFVQEDDKMGFDHGTWTVLKFLYPKADIPVFQLSLDYIQAPRYHFELAQQLKSLRKKGVLVVGSGNIVHNLRSLNWQNAEAKPHDWAMEFDYYVKQKLNNQDFNSLIDYQNISQAARLSIPTPEHYLPMLYVTGMTEPGEKVSHFYEAFEYASLSMRCFKIS